MCMIKQVTDVIFGSHPSLAVCALTGSVYEVSKVTRGMPSSFGRQSFVMNSILTWVQMLSLTASIKQKGAGVIKFIW